MTPASLRRRTVLVTREETAEGPLSIALVARGAAVVNLPLLETGPPEDPAELEAAGARLHEYDWVVFTSARAAEALRACARREAAPRIAAVGEGTARAVRRAGWEPAVIGSGGSSALARAFENEACLAGCSVLFPAADRARPETAKWLKEVGAQVTVVTAYRTVPREGIEAELAATLDRGDLDAAVFASPSAVDVLAGAVDVPSLRIRLGAIGRTTRARLEAVGAYDVIMPDTPTFEALAQALARALGPG